MPDSRAGRRASRRRWCSSRADLDRRSEHDPLAMMTSPEHDRPPQAEGDLWRHADFLRLWAAQAVSAFGSRITRTALPVIAVITLGQPESMIGVLGAMQLVPGIALAMVAGGGGDGGPKRGVPEPPGATRGGPGAALPGA